MRRYAHLGIFVAPVTALGSGVWAQVADLTPPLLLSVAVPAMVVSLLGAAIVYGLRPLMLVVVGAVIGVTTFAIAEGLYLGLLYATGGTLDVKGYESQAAMVGVLFGVHVAVGTALGLGLGVLAAGTVLVARWRDAARQAIGN